MWTIEKLKTRFGLSDQQVYRRLHAAQRLLEPHIRRGEKNAILLTEGGFRALEHVIELEKQGKTLAMAVAEVESMLRVEAPDERPGGRGDERVRALIEEVGYLKGVLAVKDELLSELKGELARLRQENDALKRSVALVELKAERARRWWFWRSG